MFRSDLNYILCAYCRSARAPPAAQRNGDCVVDSSKTIEKLRDIHGCVTDYVIECGKDLNSFLLCNIIAKIKLNTILDVDASEFSESFNTRVSNNFSLFRYLM